MIENNCDVLGVTRRPKSVDIGIHFDLRVGVTDEILL